MLPRQRSINPASGDTVFEVAEHTEMEVELRVAGAAQAARRWRNEPLSMRTALLVRTAELLEGERRELGQMHWLLAMHLLPFMTAFFYSDKASCLP